ncbi:T9SS type A sorting domain-containing protein [candidate division KSB1 bacterium]|nr:T9SS type A sorting domain-containing protein [candidate division KSB1 bacterium]
MQNFKKIASIVLSLLLLSMSTSVLAEEGAAALAKSRAGTAIAQSENTVNQTLVNIGAVAMWAYAAGNCSAYPLGGSTGGMYFPRGNSPLTWVMFTDGIIWGGIVNDGIEPAVRVGGQAFSNGTVPGAILSKGVAEDRNDDQNVNRIWRIRRDFATVKDAELVLDAAENFIIQSTEVTTGQIQTIRDRYRQDWIDWPTHKGAPFYDAEGDGEYNPQFNENGEPILYPEADEPGYANGDQVAWSVSNDLNETATIGLYGSVPIGMEQQLTMWAYRRSDALGNVVFKQFRVIYKGRADTPANATIDSMFFCQWADPDLGAGGDDFVGCDTTLDLGYVYNATATDAQFAPNGLAPAASGFDFFAGPAVPDANSTAIIGLKQVPGYKNLPMSTFAFFASGQTDQDPDRAGPYQGTLQFWNLLRGYRPRPESPPTPWVNNEGNVTRFRVAGDPVAGTGDIDSNQGDRRMLQVAGPFTMAVGDTAEMVVAALAALGSDRLSSVAVLKFFDKTAQDAFDNLFELPSPPPTPPLAATSFSNEVLLEWGSNPTLVAAVENFAKKGHVFQGYNVYQLPSSGATKEQGVRLATYDLIDETTVISQEAFDANSGQVLFLPVQFGGNTGLRHTLRITNDSFREAPLANGTPYYFGVSAYSYNSDPEAVLKTLESTMAVVVVVPQSAKPGERTHTAMGDTLPGVTHTGVSNGEVQVIVVDPTQITGHNYTVTFRIDTTAVDLSDPEHPVYETQDVWDLTDVTAGQVKLSGQTNQTGDESYLIADGMMVKVFGAPQDWQRMANGDPAIIEVANENGPLAEADWDVNGTPFMGNNVWHSLNAAGYADRYFVSTTSADESDMRFTASILVPFDWEIRFTEGGSVGYWGYSSGNTGFVPFELWNVGMATFDDASDDYRCIPWMYEAGGTADAYTPDHGEDGAFGYPAFDRIYWRVPAEGSTYEDFAAAANAGEDFTVHIGGEVLGRLLICDFDENGQPPVPGTVIRIHSTKPNTPTDKFAFSTAGFEPTTNVTQAQSDIEKINVFPNPYYGMHRNEKDYFDRYVTFSHLPERAVLRIFTLSGTLVRTIEKDSPSQFLQWDMLNEDGLPAASGVYFVHVQMDDLGVSKKLKLAIIREQQYLRRY